MYAVDGGGRKSLHFIDSAANLLTRSDSFVSHRPSSLCLKILGTLTKSEVKPQVSSINGANNRLRAIPRHKPINIGISGLDTTINFLNTIFSEL